MQDADLKGRYELAQAIAQEAGQLTLEYFNKPIEVQRKSDDSPVTIADQRAEQLLRERIADLFPDDGIIGEEYGVESGSSPYRWILDPIDGTKSFISGVPLFGTLVGLQYQEQSQAGVIYMPGLDEGIHAVAGQGAWHWRGQDDPARAQVNAELTLENGVFLFSQRDSFDERGAGAAFLELEKRAGITRTWGDCYGYLLVATGRAALMIDPVMSIWDAAALQPIMREAGGTFTDWAGQPRVDAGEGIGTHAGILEAILEVTRPYVGGQV